MLRRLKFLVGFIALGILIAFPVWAFPPTPPRGFDTTSDYTYTGKFDAGGGELQIPNGTVAEMDALTGVAEGDLFMVTDGDSAGDCSTGLASTRVLCVYDANQADWVSAGDGTGGAGSGSLTDIEISDVALVEDAVNLDFDGAVFSGTAAGSEANIGLDLTPSTGSATLVATEDALQVKYDTTDFQESTNGLYLGDSPTIATALLMGADPADAGTIRMPNAASIVFEDATEGSITHVDNTGFTVNIGWTLDAGSSNSPYLTLTDGDDKSLFLYKQDTGGAHLRNDEGAFNVQPSNDTDDYIVLLTTSDVPEIDTVNSGTNAFNISNSGGDINFRPDGDDDSYASLSTAANVTTLNFAGTGNDAVITAAGGDISFNDENISTSGSVSGGTVTDGAFSVTSGAISGATTLAMGGALSGATTIGLSHTAPTITLEDSDDAGGTGELIFASANTQDVVGSIKVDVAGSATSFMEIDGSSETVDILKPAVFSSNVTLSQNLVISGTGIELNHASANTLTASGGVLSIEGVDLVKASSEVSNAGVIADSVAVSSWNLTTPTVTSGATFTGADASPDANGELVYDNVVAGLDDGGFAYFGGSDTVYYVIASAEIPDDDDDDKVVAYDKDTDRYYMKTDNSAGTTAWDDIADPDAAGSVAFDDGETATLTSASDNETFFTIQLSDGTLTGATTALEITATDNDDSNYIPIAIYDDDGTDNDQIFKIDYTGAIHIGENPADTASTSIALGLGAVIAFEATTTELTLTHVDDTSLQINQAFDIAGAGGLILSNDETITNATNGIVSIGGHLEIDNSDPYLFFDEADGTDIYLIVDDAGNQFEISTDSTVSQNNLVEIDEDGDVHLTQHLYLNAGDDFIGVTADDTFDFTRNDSGTVTITSSDDDANAGLTVVAGGTGTLTLGNATNADISIVSDGVNISETELSYLDGVTSDIQTQITAAGTATNITPVDTGDEAATFYPVLVDGATGDQATETDGEFTYNPSTGVLTVPDLDLLGAPFPDDPGADKVLAWDDSETGAELVWSDAGSGDIIDVGPGYASGAAFTDGVVSTGTQAFVWEGTSDDGVEFIIVFPEDPSTSDSTVTFREASGTVLISGDTLTGDVTATFDTDGSTAATIANDAVTMAKLDDDGNFTDWTGNWTFATGTFTLNNGATLGGTLAVNDQAITGVEAFTGGSTTTDSGPITLIQGEQTGDPQVILDLTANDSGDFSVTTDTGDILLVSAADITLQVQDEDLVVADGGANLINVTSTTSVATVDFGTINLATDALDLSEGNITNAGQIDADTIDADGATLAIGTGSDQTVTIDSSDWTIDATGTIANTAIDGDSNTITNVPNSGIKWADIDNLADEGALVIADESSDTTSFPLFVTAATGNLAAKTGTNLTFNASTGSLAATIITDGTATMTAGALASVTTIGVSDAITLSDSATIDQAAANTVDISDNSDSLTFNFGGTDVGIVWSDGALNIRNNEDGVDAIVEIEGKDASEKGVLRVLSDGDDKYVTLYHNDTDSWVASSSGDIILAPDGDVDDYLRVSTATNVPSISPSANDDGTLGTSSIGWSDAYLADGGIIYFGDEAMITHVADTEITLLTDLAILDGKVIEFGTSDDTTLGYDEATDDRLELTTTLSAGTGDEEAFAILYTTNKATSGNDTGLLINMTDTASPGTSYLIDAQVDGTSVFAVRADGAIITAASNDPGFVLDESTASDTDWWAANNADQEGDDDDPFEIGIGTTIGTNAVFSLNTSGDLAIDGGMTADTLTLEGGTYDTGFTPGTPTETVTYTLPLADGDNGDVLVTDGAAGLSWTAVTASPAGANYQIQWSNGTAIDAEAAFTYNDDNNTMSITQSGSNPTIQTGDGTYVWGHTPMVGIEGVLEVDGVIYGDSDATLGDDLILDSDAAVIQLGADQDVLITHIADKGIQLGSAAPEILFVDSTTSGEAKIAISDGAGPDGVMDLQVDLAGTLTTYIQLDGANDQVDIAKNLVLAGTLTDGTATLNTGAWSGISTLAMTGAFSGATTMSLTHTAPTFTMNDSNNNADGTANILFQSAGAYDITGTIQTDIAGTPTTMITLDGVNSDLVLAPPDDIYLDPGGDVIHFTSTTEDMTLTNATNVWTFDSAGDTFAFADAVDVDGAFTAGTLDADTDFTVDGLVLTADNITNDATLNLDVDGTADQDLVIKLNNDSTTWAVTFDGSEGMVTIGDGDAFDHVIKFDASANDGTLTWDEDPGQFVFDNNIVIPDAGNIGSASDTDAIAIANDGVVTFSQDVVLAADSIVAADIATDAVTMDAVDADGAFTSLTGAWATTGLLSGGVVTNSKSAAYTIGTDNAAEAYGGVLYATGAMEFTLPAVVAGMSFTVIDYGGAAIVLDPDAGGTEDYIILDGTLLAQGANVTSTSTTGDMIVCTYQAADIWYCASGSPDGDHWTGP